MLVSASLPTGMLPPPPQHNRGLGGGGKRVTNPESDIYCNSLVYLTAFYQMHTIYTYGAKGADMCQD